jgi:hypothetical protein
VSILHVPEELAQRLSAEADRRHMTVDDLATELVSEGLRDHEDALEAFIGSGNSGDPDWAARDTHDLRADVVALRHAEGP